MPPGSVSALRACAQAVMPAVSDLNLTVSRSLLLPPRFPLPPAAGKVYIHGINMLPFTPASEFYLTPDWIVEEWPVVWNSITPQITDEWKGFLFGTQCVIDSNKAWKSIEKLTSFDGGNTRSNLMYFCATRPKQQQQSSHRHGRFNSSRVKILRED